MSRSFPARAALVAATLSFHAPALAQKVSYEDLEATLGEPVTTSVTGKPQRASEAPAALTIITRAEILRSPARDIPGLLKIYAGVDVNRWTAGQSDVTVRGGVQAYNPSLLVMVDGRQVYLDHYGMTNWNLIGVQLDDIQQVELVRGPASAIFGFNAASGVVNIITRSSDKARLDASVEGGNHGYFHVAATGALPIGDYAGLRLSADHAREDERAIPAYHFTPSGVSRIVRRDSLSGTLTANPGPRTQVEINGGYAFNRQLEYIGGPTLGEPQSRTFTLGGRITHDMGWGSLDGQIYSNWLKFNNIGINTVPGVTVRTQPILDNQVLVAKTSLLARLNSETTVRVGGEYRSNRVTGAILYSPAIRYDVWSANAMIDIHPTDRIALNGAVRIDRLSLHQSGIPASPLLIEPALYDRSFTTTSFNASLLVSVGREGQFRINGGRGYLSPSLLAFGIHVVADVDNVPLPIVVSGSPSLLPSEVWSGEIGYAQPIAPGVKGDANLFYTRYRNSMPLPNQATEMVVGPTGALAISSQFANVSDVTAYGAEVSLTATRGRWTGRANYSWTRTEDDGISAQNGLLFFFNPADASPRHKVNMDIGYDAKRWFATLVGRYTSASRQLAPAFLTGAVIPVDLPDTLSLDAKWGFRLAKGVSLDIAGENLTKARGAAGSPIWADRRVRAGIHVAL